jgi:hypothetical protein
MKNERREKEGIDNNGDENWITITNHSNRDLREWRLTSNEGDPFHSIYQFLMKNYMTVMMKKTAYTEICFSIDLSTESRGLVVSILCSNLGLNNCVLE